MSLDSFFNEKPKKEEPKKLEDNKCKYCGIWIINEQCCVTCYLTDPRAKDEVMNGWNPAMYNLL